VNRRLLVAGSLRVLARNKLRTFFMGLGIVVGVAALVVTRSFGTGAEDELLGKLERMFTPSSIMVVNAASVTHGGARNPGRLDLADAEALGAEIEGVVAWAATATTSAREVRAGGATRNLMIVGQTASSARVDGRGAARGEYFSAADVRSAARLALVGRVAGEALFGGEDPLGRQILIDSVPFRVQGVLEDYGMDPHGLDRDDEIHVPITTLMRRVVQRDRIGTVKLLVADPETIDDTVERVADLLRERHDLADTAPDDFTIFTPTLVRERVKEANRVVTVYLPAAAGVALLVAAIVITNIMLISVRERIPEIGLRKAVGATDRQIGAQFLLESLAVSLISALAGLALGAGVLATARMHGVPAPVAPDSAVIGLAAALAVGALAGTLPARQAARQEPVDALR